MLLTYVFQEVQVAPTTGLFSFGQLTCKYMDLCPGSGWYFGSFFLALVSSLLLKKALVADGFTGTVRRPYDLARLPVEGMAAEADFLC